MLNSNKVKELLTVEDIIKIVTEDLGSGEPIYDAQGNPIFQTVCHGGSKYKLYYYVESHSFHCYTHCGDSFDIFELVRRSKGLPEFIDAYRYVINFFHIQDDGEEEKPELTADWDIFQRMTDLEEEEKTHKPIDKINENLLQYFYPLAAPTEWLKDGISAEVMLYYGIRTDSALHKIVIPHRDIDGNLVGIRGRTYDPFELADGKKYMPVYIEGDMYAHPLGKNLFGLYENKDTIRKLKKVLICESEKAVMQCATMYGVDQCFCVATCGSSLSQDQIDLILGLGVTEVILGYDKECSGVRDAPDTKEYEAKLLKMAQPLAQYVNIYILFDYEGLLGLKDSPTDRGRETLEKMMKNKVYIPSINESVNIKRRQKI